MKICILTTVHQPFDTRVFQKEAVTLAKEHEVTLIAPYDEIIQIQKHNVTIRTVQKTTNKLLHPITLIRTLIQGFKTECDVLHCHEPGSLLVCLILKLLQGKKVVYDAHEYYPSLIANNSFFPPFLSPFINSVMDFSELTLVRFVDAIIVVREDLKERFQSITNTPVEVIFVYPDLDIFISPKKYEDHIPSQNNKTIVYEGFVNIQGRGLDKCLYSIKHLSHSYPDIELKIVGRIPEDDLKWAEAYVRDNLSASNFVVIPWVRYDEVPEILAQSTIGIILFQPTHYNNLMGIPNKLFDYMAAGIPVIASNLPNISRIVKDANCGILVNPDAEKEIAQAIDYLLTNTEEAKRFGLNGRYAVETKYNWINMEFKLISIYNNL